MAKKKIEVFLYIETEQQFEYMLQHEQNSLICKFYSNCIY